MCKYLTILITDTHFGTRNNSITWLKSQKNFFTEQFIPHIKQRKSEGYKIRIIHCGDVFDSRSTINTYIATEVFNIFYQICELVDQFNIVGGNHDFHQPTSDSVDTVNLIFGKLKLEYPGKFFIYTKHKGADFWGDEISLFVPWYEWIKHDELIEYLKENKITHIFTHADLVKDGTDIDCPNIISGHIHTPFFKDEINNLGSCFALTFTDCNSKRGFYEYEDGGELQFIENTKSIRFWRFYNEELLNIPDYINDNDYIELYASKTLLAKKKYVDICADWVKRFKNIWIIPQIDDQINKTDIKQFEGYDVEKMTESLIPNELKDKFEKIKQYINTIKD